MNALSNKIDFAVIICVKVANPNGDPLNGNRPRVDFNGYGEISDVCIKRKIRNRLLDMTAHSIFVQSNDRKDDSYGSLKERLVGTLGNDILKDRKALYEQACQRWFDVRAFGQVFPFKGSDSKGKKGKGVDAVENNEEEDKSVSVGVRGPVSIHPAFSVATVQDRISSEQITKSVNLEGDDSTRGSDTMGMKHRVDHGVYVFYGSMNPQLATKTGFSDEDAKSIKEALKTLFRNDASSARPEGSMEVYKLYWWEHNNPNGQYSSAKVHRLLEVKPNKEEPNNIADYDIKLAELPGLKCEVIDGE